MKCPNDCQCRIGKLSTCLYVVTSILAEINASVFRSNVMAALENEKGYFVVQLCCSALLQIQNIKCKGTFLCGEKRKIKHKTSRFLHKFLQIKLFMNLLMDEMKIFDLENCLMSHSQ